MAGISESDPYAAYEEVATSRPEEDDPYAGYEEVDSGQGDEYVGYEEVSPSAGVTPENTVWDDIKDLRSGFERSFKGVGKTTPEALKLSALGLQQAGISMSPDTAAEAKAQAQDVALSIPGGSYADVDTFNINAGMSDKEIQESKRRGKESIDKSMAESNKIIAENTPKNLNFVQKGLRAGLESTLQNIPGFIASAATGNPIPMLVGFGVLTGSRSFGEAKAAGKDDSEAAYYAVKDASIEVLTELLPAKYLTGIFKGERKKAVGKFILSEIGGEQIAEFMQSLNSYSHDLDEELRDVIDPIEIAKIQGERQLVALFAAGAGAAFQAGPPIIAQEILSAVKGKKKSGEGDEPGLPPDADVSDPLDPNDGKPTDLSILDDPIFNDADGPVRPIGEEELALSEADYKQFPNLEPTGELAITSGVSQDKDEEGTINYEYTPVKRINADN